MSAIRRTMLCAFAGGCLSNALLFGVWRLADGASHSAGKQQYQSHDFVESAAAASTASSVAAPIELVAASAYGHDAAPDSEPTPVAPDLANAGPTPAGSAVSDVLTRLETAYRERVAVPTPAQASMPQERASAAPSESAVAVAEAAPSDPAQPTAAVASAALTVAAAPQVASPAPAAFAPQVAPAPPSLAPQPAAAPAIALQEAPPPTVVQYGDVNQNTYITNVREGDVYQVQMQQIAVLQYMQLLGMSGGAAAPARHAGGAGRQRGALTSGITNPDNPWGFRFAPLNLVR